MDFFNQIAPEGINKIYFNRSGTNSDIIKVFFAEYEKAMQQGKKIAPIFQKDTFYKSCLNVWNFVKYGIKYEVDPEGTQTIQLPSHLLNISKKGDCKSKTLLCAAIISNFNFNGVKPVIVIRFVNYENIPAYTHVYLVAFYQGEEIIIDTVWNKFNDQKLYTTKKDYIMKINSISGFEEAYTENIEGRKSKKNKAAKKEKRGVRKEKRKEKRKEGKGLIGKGKKIALAAPRGSFLALVRLNVRGLANKLKNAPSDKSLKIWKILGGNPEKLIAAVAIGQKKKPFLGSKAQTSVEGVGAVTIVAVSTLLASAGAILAAFAPILKMVEKNKGTQDGEAATDDLLEEAKSAGGDTSIPEGQVSDPEEGSGKKPTKGGFDFDFDLKDPKVLLGGAALAFAAYKFLK